ncbi:MAG TPA: 16S rRNA (cytosine(967)-C(5))-methyltransferase RsmB [Pseudidiomarina sp.]|nr:16S rRNA (cytosine(967)-C(5))-methyltransferase RsmB [Pseudidiomarina sp.]
MNNETGAASRAAAALAIQLVLEQGRSLNQALPQVTRNLSPRDKALCQQLCFGVLRQLPELNFLVSQLLDKPLKNKTSIIQWLMLVGTYQLVSMRVAEHGAVSATVEAAKLLKHKSLAGLVNGVLRNLQRRQQELLAQLDQREDLKHNHPRWLVEAISQAYPTQAQTIMAANNSQAPLWLRVNESLVTGDQYRSQLDAAAIHYAANSPLPTALQLEHAQDVTNLPNFAAGAVSVQDIAAQHAAWLLDAQPNERILDCCAAPGGKTAHILERTPTAKVLALDSDAQRLTRVHENLDRLRLAELDVHLQQGDASQPADWAPTELFDRILLDAPCSATGVIRRHPDIKWLRRADDIGALAELQRKILDALWPHLRVGGTLLYATCSILPQENSEQIKDFCARHPDAVRLATHPNGSVDWQWLPGERAGDGFYYAKLEKRA